MVCSPEIAKNLLEIFDENMSKLESCMLDRDFQRQFLSVMYSVNCLLLLNKNVDVSHSKSADVLRNTIIGRYHTLFLCTNILRYVADEERLNILTILGKTFFQDSIVYGYQLVSGLPHTEYPGLLNMLSQKDAWQFIQMFDEQFLREKIESQDNLYRDLGSVFECLPNPNKEAKKFLLDLINNNVLPKSDEKSKETNLKLFDKKAPEVANQNNENSDEENMSKVNHGCSKPQPK
jgi:hypothetical protein